MPTSHPSLLDMTGDDFNPLTLTQHVKVTKPKMTYNSVTVRTSICVTETTIVTLGQADLMAQCTLTVTYIFKVKVQIFVTHRRTLAVTVDCN
jgi:hypothetical protein